MTARVVAIGGEPATGKSRLVSSFRTALNMDGKKVCREGACLAEFNWCPLVLVLGVYPADHPFPGTDRLSMAVQPDALKMVRTFARGDGDKLIVFEGDRLFNGSFLAALQGLGEDVHLEAWRLLARPETLAQRRLARGSTQSERFIRGRTTKLDRIEADPSRAYPLSRWQHQTTSDTHRLVGMLLERLPTGRRRRELAEGGEKKPQPEAAAGG